MVQGIIVILAGVFTIVCSALNMDWFFNSYKAQPFIKLVGRRAARFLYIVLGAFLVGAGIIFIITN